MTTDHLRVDVLELQKREKEEERRQNLSEGFPDNHERKNNNNERQAKANRVETNSKQ